ncbi:hypothetical protein [Yoonia vestfoldensis]|uniref:hypothetical protein n=1 Tax=Yoonia vestfoldensis TaxID=245188 RepID=UPI0013A5AE92|nr:hypothetical protein [Yoonia vestfoldensis]
MCRSFLIYCLIVVTLPLGALAQAASPQALFVATPASNEITGVSDAAVHAGAKEKRCRIAILTGAQCFPAIVDHSATMMGGIPHANDAPFAVAIALPGGVTTGSHLDPPRRG